MNLHLKLHRRFRGETNRTWKKSKTSPLPNHASHVWMNRADIWDLMWLNLNWDLILDSIETRFDFPGVMGHIRPVENSPADVCILTYNYIFIKWTELCVTGDDAYSQKRLKTQIRVLPVWRAPSGLCGLITCDETRARCLQVTVSWQMAVMKKDGECVCSSEEPAASSGNSRNIMYSKML